MSTHEQFIQDLRRVVIERAWKAKQINDDQVDKLAQVKLVYGRGTHGLRGLTQYNGWQAAKACDDGHCGVDLIEICALGEESWIQLAGTTIHELGHVLAGHGSGHGKEWKAACAKLGLRRVHAAGTNYQLSNFDGGLRMVLATMDKPKDGAPVNSAALFKSLGKQPPKQRVCSAGVGVRGGKSRGTGSGSRLRKYVCGHGQIIRASTDQLEATCTHCNTPFELQGADGNTAAQLIAMLSPATQAALGV